MPSFRVYPRLRVLVRRGRRAERRGEEERRKGEEEEEKVDDEAGMRLRERGTVEGENTRAVLVCVESVTKRTPH